MKSSIYVPRQTVSYQISSMNKNVNLKLIIVHTRHYSSTGTRSKSKETLTELNMQNISSYNYMGGSISFKLMIKRR